MAEVSAASIYTRDHGGTMSRHCLGITARVLERLATLPLRVMAVTVQRFYWL